MEPSGARDGHPVAGWLDQAAEALRGDPRVRAFVSEAVAAADGDPNAAAELMVHRLRRRRAEDSVVLAEVAVHGLTIAVAEWLCAHGYGDDLEAGHLPEEALARCLEELGLRRGPPG